MNPGSGNGPGPPQIQHSIQQQQQQQQLMALAQQRALADAPFELQRSTLSSLVPAPAESSGPKSTVSHSIPIPHQSYAHVSSDDNLDGGLPMAHSLPHGASSAEAFNSWQQQQHQQHHRQHQLHLQQAQQSQQQVLPLLQLQQLQRSSAVNNDFLNSYPSHLRTSSGPAHLMSNPRPNFPAVDDRQLRLHLYQQHQLQQNQHANMSSPSTEPRDRSQSTSSSSDASNSTQSSGTSAATSFNSLSVSPTTPFMADTVLSAYPEQPAPYTMSPEGTGNPLSQSIEPGCMIAVKEWDEGKGDRADFLGFVRSTFEGFSRIIFKKDGTFNLVFRNPASASEALEVIRSQSLAEVEWINSTDLSPEDLLISNPPIPLPPSNPLAGGAWLTCVIKISSTSWDGRLSQSEMAKLMQCYGGIRCIRLLPDDFGRMLRKCRLLFKEHFSVSPTDQEEERGEEEEKDEGDPVAMYCAFQSRPFAAAAVEDVLSRTNLKACLLDGLVKGSDLQEMVSKYGIVTFQRRVEAVMAVMGLMDPQLQQQQSQQPASQAERIEEPDMNEQTAKESLYPAVTSLRIPAQPLPSIEPPSDPTILSCFESMGFVHLSSLPEDFTMASLRKLFGRLEGFRFFSLGANDSVMLAFGSGPTAAKAADALKKTTRMDVSLLPAEERQQGRQSEQMYLPPPSLIALLGGWNAAAESSRFLWMSGKGNTGGSERVGGIAGTAQPSSMVLVHLETWMNPKRVCEMFTRRDGLEAFIEVESPGQAASPEVTAAPLGLCLRFRDTDTASKALDDLEKSTDLAVEFASKSFLQMFENSTAGSSSRMMPSGMSGPSQGSSSQLLMRTPSDTNLGDMGNAQPPIRGVSPQGSFALGQQVMGSGLTHSQFSSLPSQAFAAAAHQALMRNAPRKVSSVPCLPRQGQYFPGEQEFADLDPYGPGSILNLRPNLSSGMHQPSPHQGMGFGSAMMTGAGLGMGFGAVGGMNANPGFGYEPGLMGAPFFGGMPMPMPMPFENAMEKIMPSRTIYVSGFGSMDKADIKAMCKKFAGFIRIQFGQANFRVVLNDLECAKEAMKTILAANFVKASYARKEPEEKKIDELGEPSKVLWTSTLYWSEVELRKYLHTYEGFERLVFDASHSWIHFKDVESARVALEDLNSTTNLYSVFSKKAERHPSASSILSLASISSVSSGGFASGSSFGLGGPTGSGGAATVSGGPIVVSPSSGPVQMLPMGHNLGGDRGYGGQFQDEGFFASGQSGFALADGSLLNPIFPNSRMSAGFGGATPGGRQPLMSPNHSARGLRKVASYSGLPTSSSGGASLNYGSSTAAVGVFPYSGGSAPFAIPAAAAASGSSSVSSSSSTSPSSAAVVGMPANPSSASMGTVGVATASASRRDASMFGLVRGVRAGTISGEHFPVRAPLDGNSRRPSLGAMSNVLIIRNSTISEERDLRRIFGEVDGFEDLLIQRLSASTHIYVRFSSTEAARIVYEGYGLRDVLGGSFGSVSFQYRFSGEVPAMWEPLLLMNAADDICFQDAAVRRPSLTKSEESGFSVELDQGNPAVFSVDPWAKAPSHGSAPLSANSGSNLSTVSSFWNDTSSANNGGRGPASAGSLGKAVADPWTSSNLPGSGPSSAGVNVSSVGSEGSWPSAHLRTVSAASALGTGDVVGGSSAGTTSSASGSGSALGLSTTSLRRSSSFLYGTRGSGQAPSPISASIPATAARMIDDIWAPSSSGANQSSIPASTTALRKNSVSRITQAEGLEFGRSRLASSSSAVSTSSTLSGSGAPTVRGISATFNPGSSVLPPRIDTAVGDRWRTVSAPSFAEDITSVGPKLSTFNPNVAAFIPSWADSSVSSPTVGTPLSPSDEQASRLTKEEDFSQPPSRDTFSGGSSRRGSDDGLRFSMPTRIDVASALLRKDAVVWPGPDEIAIPPVDAELSQLSVQDSEDVASTEAKAEGDGTRSGGSSTPIAEMVEREAGNSASALSQVSIGGPPVLEESYQDIRRELKWAEAEMARLILALEAVQRKSSIPKDQANLSPSTDGAELLSSTSTSSSLTSIATIANESPFELAFAESNKTQTEQAESRIHSLVQRVWHLVGDVVKNHPSGTLP
ncbi:hypothetical protein HDU97_001522 [Phlyctochytrium planicorne]|nr:hypothetical protein HDU97_001522 [Phlyctochytrium planicorne]